MVDLRETLQLERLEVNLFRGFSPAPEAGRIYGGQVIAQSLQAAYSTVEGRTCHSLHCYSSGRATRRSRSSSRWTGRGTATASPPGG